MNRHFLTLGDDRGAFYLLGSDSTGRDVYSRLLYGAQVSLFVGLIGITITTTLGFIVGGLSGYFAGRTDFVVMRMVEFLMAIPSSICYFRFGLLSHLTLRPIKCFFSL